MSKHTPGPWSYVFNSASCPTCHCIDIKGGERIGTVSYCQSYVSGDYDDREETIANARLIAAAPDLLDACIAGDLLSIYRAQPGGHDALIAIGQLEKMGYDKGGYETPSEFTSRLRRAAIAKATGD